MSNTILIVDDSAMVRRYVRKALEGLGFDVVDAADGHAALELLATRAPALLISDLNMAPMNGFELVAEVRQKYSRKELPVLMLTTESDDKLKLRGKEVGANGWLVKPFEANRMGAVIRHLLASSSHVERQE